MHLFSRIALCLVFLGVSTNAYAAQPVFSEMPRWDDGWGFQIVPEYRYKSGLITGTETTDEDLSEHIGILHIDGVYTWDRSIRLTAKLPVVVYASRNSRDTSGRLVEQTDASMGDATVALPLKHYFNLDGRSGSWTLAPQLRIPLGAKDEYSVFPRSWGLGLSAGVETESYDFVGGIGFGGWYYFDEKPASFQTSLSVGLNVHAWGSSGHIKLKTYLDIEDDGSVLVRVGPVMYWRFTDLVHGQVTWEMDVYNWRATAKMGNAQSITAGAGFVF